MDSRHWIVWKGFGRVFHPIDLRTGIIVLCSLCREARTCKTFKNSAGSSRSSQISSASGSGICATKKTPDPEPA